VNRSDKRAHVEPRPVCRVPERAKDWDLGKRIAAVNRRLKMRQTSLFPKPDVDERGRRARTAALGVR